MLQVERILVAGQEGVKISGEVGYENAPLLRRVLLQLLALGHDELLLDVEAVHYLDGGAILALLSVADVLPPPGRIVLVNPTPNARRLLELANRGSAEPPRIVTRHAAELVDSGV